MKKASFLSKSKTVLLGTAIGLLTLGATACISTEVNPQSNTALASVKAASGQWGGANWVLANSGELIFSGGDIGTPKQALSVALTEANIDLNTVKSIEFTTKTSASNIGRAFADLPELEQVFKLNNLSYSGSAASMFQDDSKLQELDLTGFDTSKITNMSYMFYQVKVPVLDVSGFDTSNVTNMYAMFDNMSNVTHLDVSHFNTDKVTSMAYMFLDTRSLTEVDVSGFNTSNVNNMSGMFDRAEKLTHLDVSNFNTEKVNNMAYMFMEMPALTELDLSNFDTANVTNMQGMFTKSTQLTNLDLSNFNTDKVTNMSSMFIGMTALKDLDISNFNTANVTTMYAMFDADSSLENLDVSHFNTEKVTNMSYMFYHMLDLSELDVYSFNTSNVTNMLGMFEDLTNIKSLDVSNFDTKNVTNMQAMFRNMPMLEKLDISSLIMTSNTNISVMFSGDSKLKMLKLGAATQLNNTVDLPNITSSGTYSGKWQNVGTGTVSQPAGEHVWTSSELMTNYDAPTMADTYVWQSLLGNEMAVGEVKNYSDDLPLTTYMPSASTPVHPYRYNVLLTSDDSFYTKLEDGQIDTDNAISLGEVTGRTVYNKECAKVTYTSGAKEGQTTEFEHVSLDGTNWYWIEQHALNMDLLATYPATNKHKHELLDGMYYGSTTIYGTLPIANVPVNSQMIANAYNSKGKIIYQSLATLADFASDADPAACLAAFNKELDRAAQSWNEAINPDDPTLIESSKTSDPITLKVSVNPTGGGSATLNGNTGIEVGLVTWALDTNDQNYDLNLLFVTMRHELGHSLGLAHTSHAQYYGMPDDYRTNVDEDVMNASLTFDPTSGYVWSQRIITPESVKAIHLIINNHNFMNPIP